MIIQKKKKIHAAFVHLFIRVHIKYLNVINCYKNRAQQIENYATPFNVYTCVYYQINRMRLIILCVQNVFTSVPMLL
jgi:hypothetical protein